jgi:flagellar protein FlaG
MSVELTTMTIDTLPVKPHNDQESDRQKIDNFTEIATSGEKKLTEAREALALESSDQMRKKDSQDEDKVMSKPQLEEVAKQLQEFMGKMNRGLEFSVDKDSGRDVIKVLDKTSGELIKQYPTEEVLSLVAKLSEATGNFVDSKV